MIPITRREKYLSAIAGESELDNDMTPITREEKYLQKILDEGGSIIHFVQGDTNTADMEFEKAVQIHNSGKPLTAYVTAENSMTAVSNTYIYNGSVFIFGITIGGIVSGSVVWSASQVQITMGE